MSALGHKRTFYPLFDHVVRARLQRRRHAETQRLGGLEVDIKLDFRAPQDRQIAGLFAFENPSGVYASLMISRPPSRPPKKYLRYVQNANHADRLNYGLQSSRD